MLVILKKRGRQSILLLKNTEESKINSPNPFEDSNLYTFELMLNKQCDLIKLSSILLSCLQVQ